jgi:hypothetical protein
VLSVIEIEVQHGAFKGSMCQFHNCDVWEGESDFYEDNALSMDADTRNSEGMKYVI